MQNSRFQKFMSKYSDFPKPLRKGKYPFIIVMLSLSVISWLVFYVYVNINSILMSFQYFRGYDENFQAVYEWSFGNFRLFFQEMFGTASVASSTKFRDAVLVTLFLFFLGNAFSIPMQFLVSYFLYKKVPGHGIFKILLYLPHILTQVVMVTIFKNIVSANGLLTGISLKFGGEPVHYLLTDSKYAKWTILMYNNWVGFAGSYIILTAAMMRLPGEVIESAKLDGCGAWREFWQLIVPMIWPTLQIIIIEKVAALLSADGPILLMTEGKYDTTTIGYWFYTQVNLSMSFEYPSAIGLIMTCFVAPLALAARKLTDRVFNDVEF